MTAFFRGLTFVATAFLDSDLRLGAFETAFFGAGLECFLAEGLASRVTGLGFAAGFLALCDDALADFFFALFAIEEVCGRICHGLRWFSEGKPNGT